MSTMVQIRNVPADVHRVLRTRAAHEGLSLSDYLLREMSRLAQRPTAEELMARIRARAPVSIRESSGRAVRAEREGRR